MCVYRQSAVIVEGLVSGGMECGSVSKNMVIMHKK